MLGGAFSVVVENEENRFLVISLWKSESSHERYVTDSLQRLREQAGTADDVEEMTGHRILLEKEWTVLGHANGSQHRRR